MENKKITYCEFCKKQNPKHYMNTCSRKCSDELKKIKSREERECIMCKSKFSVRKKESKQLCSEGCRKKWSMLPENVESRILSSKIAVKDLFGVDNVFQLEIVKEKLKGTKLERYGDENYNNADKMIETKDEKYGIEWRKKWYKNVENEMIKNYGVKHALQTKVFLDKLNNTNLKKYGCIWNPQRDDMKKSTKETIQNKYKVDNVSQLDEVKQKKKDTSLKNFGVTHHLKDYNLFQKHLIAQYKVKKYKDTNLYYQGSYEKHFLELMEGKGKLAEIQNGKSYEFEWEGEKHTYHTDFFYNNENIEIKSGWTYNKNGKDLDLENFNKTKWQSVKTYGDKIIVLIDKSSIDNFILNLTF